MSLTKTSASYLGLLILFNSDHQDVQGHFGKMEDMDKRQMVIDGRRSAERRLW